MNRLLIFTPRSSFKSVVNRMCTSVSSDNNNNILVECIGHITTIGINRPSKRNCVDLQTSIEMKKAFEDFENDANAYVAVLHGVGGNFCAGFDLNEFENVQDQTKLSKLLEDGLMGLPHFVTKPVVAGISGYAVGGGLELALLCDLRVVEDTAVMGLFGRRFGVPLTDGATVRLQAMIGLSRTLDMVLTGRSVVAEEALDWGLANRIVACGTALGQAIQLAGSLVKFPQQCLKIDRNSTYRAAYNKVYEDLLLEEKKNAKSVLLKDVVEGAKKFFSGLGRHGKFYNLTDREVKDWETEFVSLRKKPKSKL